MLIYNMKINSKALFKIVFVILFVIIIVLTGIGLYKIFSFQDGCVKNSLANENVNNISSANYTNVLKNVHENLNTYIGMKIKVTGFVYRLYDFNESQFVIAREMIVSSDYQGVIVGFLCNLNEASEYKDGTWVEIEGEITKGEYHGEIPVIEIYKIKETNIPNDEYVYPPDENYVATTYSL